MNLLITGAAGFIGSHACETFISLGYNIIGVDNFDPFYPRRFKQYNLRKLLNNKQFVFHNGNIRDRGFLNSVFTSYKIDAVLHFAAKAGVRPSIKSIEDYYATNLGGTIALLETMKMNHVSKMIFISSSSVYGNNTKVPFSEDAVVDFPISPYASSKKSGELICHVYSHLNDFDITCLRLFTVFGPRQRPDLAIHKFTRLIDSNEPLPFFGDGSTARDYTYIDDIISGIVCAFNHLGGFRVYNLGESRTISLIELIQCLEDCLSKKALLNYVTLPPGDVQITYADISKAKREIGYNPVFSFETGVRNFVEWYNEAKYKLYQGTSVKNII